MKPPLDRSLHTSRIQTTVKPGHEQIVRLRQGRPRLEPGERSLLEAGRFET